MGRLASAAQCAAGAAHPGALRRHGRRGADVAAARGRDGPPAPGRARRAARAGDAGRAARRVGPWHAAPEPLHHPARGGAVSARFCLPRTLLTYDLTPRALALYVVLAARADATGTTPEIPVGELARAIQLRDATGFARVVGELARAHLVEVVRRGRGHPHAYRLNTDPDPMPAFKTVAPRAADDPAGRPDQTNLTGDDPAGRPDHR